MGTNQIMLPAGQYNIVDKFENYEYNPQFLLRPPYRVPFYNRDGIFFSSYKRDVIVEGFNYFPKVLIWHREFSNEPPRLYIEDSISKGILGNNFEEWTDRDLERYVRWRVSVLRAMGIETAEQFILNARVNKFHFLKNYLFPDEETFLMFFALLERTKYPYLIGNPKLYPNGGRYFRYHSNIWAISFYDKFQELLLRDRTLAEQLMADGIRYILRAEVQFNDRKKLESYMRSLGFRGANTLANMFSIRKLTAIFNKVYLTLHEKAPHFHLNKNTLGALLQSIQASTTQDVAKKFMALALQRERDIIETEKLITGLAIRGSTTFITKNHHILTSTQYIQNIFLKLRSITADYRPIQDCELDIREFINFRI